MESLQSQHTTLANLDHWYHQQIPLVAIILDVEPHLRSNSEQQTPINSRFVTTPEHWHSHLRLEPLSLQHPNNLTTTLEFEHNSKTKKPTHRAAPKQLKSRRQGITTVITATKPTITEKLVAHTRC